MNEANLESFPLQKSHGLIPGLSSFRLTSPYFWIGVPPSWQISTETRSKLNKKGQFFMLHPHGGSPCDNANLHGIFLPLDTCKDEIIFENLIRLKEKYYHNPFKSARANLDEILIIREDLLNIGPLEITKSFRTIGEAYFPVTLTPRLYSWLSENFEMVIQFSYKDKWAKLDVIKTQKLEYSLKDFFRWFFSYDFLSTESNIAFSLTCAFIYPNSDVCDNFGIGSLIYPEGIE